MDFETYTPRNLFAGDHPVVTEGGQVATDDALSAGQLLHRAAPTDDWATADDTTDLSAGEAAILGHDVEAPADGTVQALVYLVGTFRASELTGYDAASHKADLRRQSLFIKE